MYLLVSNSLSMENQKILIALADTIAERRQQVSDVEQYLDQLSDDLEQLEHTMLEAIESLTDEEAIVVGDTCFFAEGGVLQTRRIVPVVPAPTSIEALG